MSEREPQSVESPKSVEGAEQLKAAERKELTAEQLEVGKEKQSEQLQQARTELEKQPEAVASANEQEGTEPTHHPTRLDKEAAYWNTLRSLQRHLSPASRNFSKLIHTPAIEKTSEVAGATIARPSVLLGATSTAAVLGGFLYITARINGFNLSGSEFLLSLIVGAVLGLIIEGIAKLFKRKD